MDLSKELSAYIERYCDGKGHSLTTLSRESGVPYGSVKRIAQGESIPEFYNTLKILMVVRQEPGECFAFIRRHYHDVGDFLAKVNFEPGRKNLADALADKISFYIINIAAAKGISRAEVVDSFGRNGLATLEMLLDKEILREVNNLIVADDFSFPNIESLLGQLKFLIEDFDVSKLGNEKSMASLQVFGINDRGIHKIFAAQKLFLQRISEIKEQEEFSGDHVMFLATLFNTLGGNCE